MTAGLLLLAAAVHVHGQGQLDIAIESGQLDVYLTAPESDLADPDEPGQAALEAKFARDGLFTFDGASCQLVSSRVEPAKDLESIWEDDTHEAHADDHEDDASAHHSDHSDHADEHQGHVDYQISWTYRCTLDPERMRVGLFELSRLEEIRFQALGESGTRVGDLTPAAAEIELP